MSAPLACVSTPSVCCNFDYSDPQLTSKLAIVSSSLSCVGSIAIAVSFIVVKELRTGSQWIILLLALADFFTSFGYIIGSINFLTMYSWDRNATKEADCNLFSDTCTAQSFLTTWSSMCSQAWTCVLATYFLLLTCRPIKLGARALLLSNVLVWGLPLVPVSVLFSTGHLGYSGTGAAGWCFINDQKPNISSGLLIGLTLVGGKLTEMLTYIWVIAFYFITIYKMCKVHGLKKKGSEIRLVFIPICYVLLRIWGTAHFFYTLQLRSRCKHQCIVSDSSITDTVAVLNRLQAIGDPGQGWCNAILYILFSPIYRTKLIVTPSLTLISWLVAVVTYGVQTCTRLSMNAYNGGRVISVETTSLLEP